MSEVESIKRRFNRAESLALQFRGMYERAYQLVAPNQNAYTEAAGANKSPQVFDSSGALAANSFVNTFMNTVTPVHSRWIDLKAGIGLPMVIAQLQGNQEPTDQDIENIESEVNESLDGTTKDMFSFLNASNLYSELATGYYDASIGTMAMLIMPGDTSRGLGSPIRFKTVSPYYLALEEGAFGDISGVFRSIESKVRDIKVEWPDVTGMGSMDGDEKVKLLESTIINDDDGLWDYRLMKGNDIIVRRRFRQSPWIIFRYNVIAGEVWGRGPVLQAFPDLQQLNAAEELSIRASQMSAYGAYTVINDDIINPNSMRVIPGAMIPVKRNNGPNGPSIQPLPGIGNVNHQLLIKSDLQAKIRRFMLDESLPSAREPGMTATEVLERVRKIQRDFGAVFGRISYELLQPIIQRSLDILVDQGLVQLPEVFSKIDSFNIKMQVISPVARMQSIQDVEALTQTIQMLGAISPELIPQQVKIEQLGQWLSDKLGAPAKFFKTSEEQQMEAQAQAEQQQALLEQEQQAQQQVQ